MNAADTLIRGVCPHDCPDACALQTRVRDGRALDIGGDTQHPYTAGWLCAKVSPYLERVYHADRLQTPLRRVGERGANRWQPVSWGQAIDEIAERWGAIIDRHGAEAILPYSYSGTLGLVQMNVASARFWNRLGASQLQRSICMAATRHAIRATLGARMSPPYHQVLNSSLLIFWGHNPVSTAPHLMPFVRRAQKRGCKLVVIDPQRSRSCRGADLHLRPFPGTDAALALGVARLLIENDWHDPDWLALHAHGFDAFQAHLDRYDLDQASKACGVDTADMRNLAELLATHKPAMIRLGDAVNRNLQGGQTVRAIAALPALLGQYGVLGGGLACSTGDYFPWDDEAINHWKECPPPGRSVNMNRLGAALCGEDTVPAIHSLFVFGANPVVSAPNTSRVLRGLQRDDLFTVVHDLFLTDTARQADIVLPATSQLEQVDLHRGYGHTLLAYNRPAIEPLGESRSNWAVMQSLAQAMGFDETWLHESADEVIDGILRATALNETRLEGISLERLQRETFIDYAAADEVPFATGHFPTPSGKVELFSEYYGELGLSPLPEWRDLDRHLPTGTDNSLHLVSPAAHHFVNSSMGNQADLLRRERPPAVLLNPLDADRLGIREGQRVRVYNQRGHCFRQARVGDAVRVGVAVATNGYWADNALPSTINWTTSDALADVAGQSTFQSNRVWIEPLESDQQEKNQ